MIISEKVTLDHLCIREEDGDVCPDSCFGRELLSPLWGFPTHLVKPSCSGDILTVPLSHPPLETVAEQGFSRFSLPSLISSCLPWQNFPRLSSPVPRRGLPGISSAVFTAVLIKYFPQSAPRMTPLPEL